MRSTSSGSTRVLVVEQARGVWGAQHYLLRLAPLLSENGVDLTLAGPSSLELHDAWRDAGLPSVALDIPVDRNIRSSGRPSLIGIVREAGTGVRVAGQIASLVRSGGYDAVWANAHWVHFDASVAGRMCRRPVVLHLHEEAMPGLGRLLRAGAVQTATRTVAVSEQVAAGLPGMVRAKVDVIPNGVDTEAMSPAGPRNADQVRALRASLGVTDDDVMVLAATRLDPVKRIEDLIDAVRRLDDPRVRLVIAGSTSAYPAYAERVRGHAKSSCGERVNFCGVRSNMAEMFRASDVVIHAGMVEGMPLGLIEAQSCAKPVVAYKVAGVPEAVLDGTTGMLVAAGDVDGLSAALGTLVRDAAQRERMGLAARAHALSHHRIETQAARNTALLKKVCDPLRTKAT